MSLRACFVLAAITMAATFVTACVGNNSTTSTTGGGNTNTTTNGGGGTGNTGGSTTSSVTTGSGGTTTTTGCQTNADCVGDSNGSICDPISGLCVACLPASDPAVDCGIGQYCNANSGQCEAGCTGDVDCTGGNGSLTCDTDKHVCVGCVDDSGCPAGTICVGDSCIPGCNEDHLCAAGNTCCGQQCFNLSEDENNCGMCNNTCPQLNNAIALCSNGQCVQGQCLANFKDCNGDPLDGCETNTLIDSDCACDPGVPDLPPGCDENLAGVNCICKVQPNSPLCICYTDPANPACSKDNEKQSCYLGAPGTENKGTCHAGTRMCKDSGIGWGPCQGQVLPAPEVCGNGLDENCDGTADNATDTDGDGWSTCEGDCNDFNPGVNPGAFEVTYAYVDDDNDPLTPPVLQQGGNGVDDDCDPTTLDAVEPAPCSTVEKLTGVTADDLRKAMDICQTTTPNPPKPQKKWGLLTAEFKLGNGSTPSASQLTNITNKQTAVQTQFGWIAPQPPAINFCKAPQEPNNIPHKGPTMAGLSTGAMRYVGQAGFVANPGGPSNDFSSGTACPAAYLAAHANALPSSSGCNGNCPTGNSCNDSVNLRMTMRVPSNAKGFSYDFRFVSAEFPEWVCQTFNDFYLALLQTGAAGLPADKNVSFDGLGNALSVNNGFFDVCQASGCFPCLKGTKDLDCTGMENGKGGATSWLTTDAPVVPSETITLEMMVFDVQDRFYDSHALIDNFRWVATNVTLGTHE